MKTLIASLVALGAIVGAANAGFITQDERQALPRGVSMDDFATALPRHPLDNRNSALPRGISMDDFKAPLPRADSNKHGLTVTP